MALILRRHGDKIFVIIAIAMTFGVAACGGGGSEQTYSASGFLECLSAKDVGPRHMETGGSEGDRYFDALDQIASQAARQNGAIEAFGNDALPGASTSYFLFFDAHDAAQAAHARLKRLARDERSSDKLEVRDNLLTVASTETEAQRRIVDECLDRSKE
jgi:hypothetical protein